MPVEASEFDRKFDDGEDISEHVDWSKARRPGLESRRVNADFPAWMVTGLDPRRPPRHHRQSRIKMWIADRLE